MREIKFRGKRIDNSEWVYGYYFSEPGDGYLLPEHGLIEGETEHYIMTADMENINVGHSTVGQYTGIKDRNGKEIFEGDILRDIYTGNKRKVQYSPPGFVLVDASQFFYGTYHANEYEIIGNIHQNPELAVEA